MGEALSPGNIQEGSEVALELGLESQWWVLDTVAQGKSKSPM